MSVSPLRARLTAHPLLGPLDEGGDESKKAPADDHALALKAVAHSLQNPSPHLPVLPLSSEAPKSLCVPR